MGTQVAEDVGAAIDHYDDYEAAEEMQAPVLTGRLLGVFVALAESSLFPPVRNRLLRQNGVPQLLEETDFLEGPLLSPDTTKGWRSEPQAALTQVAGGAHDANPASAAADAAAASGFPSSTTDAVGASTAPPHSLAAALHAAYLSGATTPTAVAERVIAGIEESEAMTPPMRFLIAFDPSALRAQAAASTARYQAGRPLSVLDGVPFAVKDEVDVLPFGTSAGTAFLAASRPAEGTIPGAAALMAAGAVLVGKTTMHEIGLGTTGFNTTMGTARNPHAPAHHTGGSSSGSAAIVAAGLCAFALGADGGGSIRIPAALCGCVGLKPTHERVCPFPAPPMVHSVGVMGPLAGSVVDAALAYALVANRGHAAHGMALPPPLLLPDLSAAAVSRADALAGKTAGVHWAWFEHADPGVVAACRQAVQLLESRGLRVQAVAVPELHAAAIAHSVTIASEMRSGMATHLRDGATRRRLNAETRISLAMVGGMPAHWYVAAQKLRRRQTTHFQRLFAQVDFIITPTVPIPAPAIRPAALHRGESDLVTTRRLMRFATPANFVGFPAISVPVGAVPAVADPGRGGAGAAGTLLPVGLQFMAAPWHEASLLHAAAVLEAALPRDAVPQPAVHWDLLG